MKQKWPRRAAALPLRCLLAALLAALCLRPVPLAASDASETGSAAELPEAGELTAGFTVISSDGQSTAPLTDRSRGTRLVLEGANLEIVSERPFQYVYLIWDRPPERWTLEGEGQSAQSYGGQGFLHELAALEGPASAATLTLDAGASFTLCDVYLFGEGTLPGWVQQWQPTLQQADLLALPTHADDEHLFFGGILPTYAGERRLAVQVAYLTNHWEERYRPHELLDGLWTVGVTAYPVMGPFVDMFASKESLAAAEQVYGREAVLAWQVEQLRRFRPQVVVGHDLAGEYGHGAHVLNASTLVEAVPLAADETAHPESLAAHGAWQVSKLYLHLYAENEVVMDWNVPLERFGGATAFETAVAGFAKHTSQQEYFSVQQSGAWQDCRRFGLYHTTVGPDTGLGDLFEHIDLEPEPEPPAPEEVSSDVSEELPAASASPPPPPEPVSSAPPEPEGAPGRVLVLAVVIGGGAGVVVAAIWLALRHRRRK